LGDNKNNSFLILLSADKSLPGEYLWKKRYTRGVLILERNSSFALRVLLQTKRQAA